jgi:mannose-6-phosphate isomerase-like protein (cupin superfamily)
MSHTSSSLKAFKRGASLGLSRWYMGNLTTNLAEEKDTNGAFCLVEVTLAPGSNPPPHVHSREDELFYGEFDVYAGEDAFKVETGQCVFLPRFKPHAFVMRSPRLRLLTLFTPAGLEEGLSQHEFACPDSGPSCGGAYLFDRRFETDGTTTQRVRSTTLNSG